MSSDASRAEAKPRRSSWFRPPKKESPDGSMSLGDHLREIRYRVTISALALVLAAIGCAFFYQPLVLFIMEPYNVARADVKAANPEANLQLANTGVTGPFTLGVVILIVCGLIITIPVWLYQIWAFVAPGLLAKEKKYVLYFMAAGIPLFLAGCAMGYWVWPKGIAVMLSFTPQDLGIMNYQDMAEFVTLELKIILIFGGVLPAARDRGGPKPAQCGARPPAQEVAQGRVLRLLRVGRGRHPVDRPVHHALHGGPHDTAVLPLRDGLPRPRQTQGHRRRGGGTIQHRRG